MQLKVTIEDTNHLTIMTCFHRGVMDHAPPAFFFATLNAHVLYLSVVQFAKLRDEKSCNYSS